MRTRVLEADDAAPAVGGYAQALEVTGAARTLYISGQVPVAADGSLAAGFAEQCRQAWANVEAQLRAAGMGLDNLVKVTTFLASRAHAMENREIRQEILGGRRVAVTVIVAGIFDEQWLIEIEAIATA
jgi:enamine deaminase RidA (YjgF/YER057c/UK114 family)